MMRPSDLHSRKADAEPGEGALAGLADWRNWLLVIGIWAAIWALCMAVPQ